ncbi:MAG: RluA family pseudouridine synthase [Candidatus Pacebacteria bacterium]|nr:RluA family pseudouridine synthase [Candidatus Paceibacterota bacterium]
MYEDNHVIAVVKPAGILTQLDQSGEESLEEAVRDYLKIKYDKPGNVFLGPVHRLDRPVQGIVLFGKTSKGTARLSDQFREHRIQKTYHAIVLGKPKDNEGQIKEQISKISFFAESFVNKSDRELLQAIRQATKTRTAELSWFLVGSNGKCSLLRIVPRTGRFHQIRVQMANMGHPVLGDRKYAQGNDVRRMGWGDGASIALAATGIRFKAITADKWIDLAIPLPEEWSKYLH